MSTNLVPLQPIPTPTAAFVDPKTGLIDLAWYQYLKRLDDHIRDVERRLTAGGL
ncbi:hypothetical protein [Rhizobium tubonense]|uniref:hypothetical protein n=1 Tax=Rhizobium tubonense TaxID=484088 RepID=UPI0012B69A29|nr:hypothetical protein [Rhizobium tubonense]